MKIWEPAGGNRLRCTKHPSAAPFVRGKGRCSECPPPGAAPSTNVVEVTDLAKAAELAVATPPDGCKTVAQHEAEFVRVAEFCEKQAQAIVDDKRKSRPSQSLAIKWVAEALKARRAAAELAGPRERKKRVRELEKLAHEILAGRKRGRAGGAN